MKGDSCKILFLSKSLLVGSTSGSLATAWPNQLGIDPAKYGFAQWLCGSNEPASVSGQSSPALETRTGGRISPWFARVRVASPGRRVGGSPPAGPRSRITPFCIERGLVTGPTTFGPLVPDRFPKEAIDALDRCSIEAPVLHHQAAHESHAARMSLWSRQSCSPELQWNSMRKTGANCSVNKQVKYKTLWIHLPIAGSQGNHPSTRTNAAYWAQSDLLWERKGCL